MEPYCVICRWELEAEADFVNSHKECLTLDEAVKNLVVRGAKGFSRRISPASDFKCEICYWPNANLAVFICNECFIDAKTLAKEKKKQDQLRKAEQERVRLIVQKSKEEARRRYEMTSRTPDFGIKVCSSCNLPIRQWDSRCGCT